MAAIELFSNLLGNNLQKMFKGEIYFIESELILRIFTCLNEEFKQNFVENGMQENNFIVYLIKDIISTEEYTLEGIACYTQTSVDVIYDITIGRNLTPSFLLSRRIMELHRQVRPELYKEIIRRLNEEFKSGYSL